MEGCERPFIVMPIPNSNMVLLVADTLCPYDDAPFVFATQPVEKTYNGTLQCYKSRNGLYRRQLRDCFNHHINETGIDICGKGSRLTLSFHLFSFMSIVIFKFYNLFYV